MALGIASGLTFSSPDMCGCSYAKIVYDTNQTGNSGIRIDDIFDGIAISNADTFTVTANMYLTGSGDTFDDGTDDVSLKFQMGGATAFNSAIAQNTLVSISGTSGILSMGSQDDLVMQIVQSDDFPDAGATIYIGNLIVTLQNPAGVIKGIYRPDFSECGDVSVIGLYSVEGSLTRTKGNCLP